MFVDPYLATVTIFAGNFAPRGWQFCNGQLLAISQNDALFALIGTTYGGDGQTTFALPDLRSRFAIHAGQGAGLQNYQVGQMGGQENVTMLATPPEIRNGMAVPSRLFLALSAIADKYEDCEPAGTGLAATGVSPGVRPSVCICK